MDIAIKIIKQLPSITHSTRPSVILIQTDCFLLQTLKTRYMHASITSVVLNAYFMVNFNIGLKQGINTSVGKCITSVFSMQINGKTYSAN